MPPTSLQASLVRQIARLERRLKTLYSREQRFAWIRLAAFLTGLAGVILSASYLNAGWTRLIFLGSALVFALIVVLHRRLDRSILQFEIVAEIRRTQLARLEVAWQQIPLSYQPEARRALDIDLDLSGPRSLHHLLNLAVSQEGSVRLLAWLTAADPDPALIRERQRVVAELAALPRFSDRLLLNLRLISKDLIQGSRLIGWLEAPLPAQRLKTLILVGAGAAVINLSLLTLNALGRLPPYWILTLALYFAYTNYNARHFKDLLAAIVDLEREMGRFQVLLQHLESFPLGNSPHLAQLLAPFRDPARLPSALLKRIKWVTAGVGLRSNPILGLLVNLITPWDALFALLASRLREQARARLPLWMQTWYDLEALCSLGEFARLHPGNAFPAVDRDSAPVLQTQALGHPLIPPSRRQSNDFAIERLGQVLILTGSNMAGKSTFLKTLGINLCLAYAGGPVCAQSLSMRPFRLGTCMKISDSLADGWSYFFAEVQCLKTLLDSVSQAHPDPVFYLIDELFRGTNNRERLIGSRAFIHSLIGADCVGLIATHDLELASLAEDTPLVLNYHFKDRVENGKLVFDYQLQPGACPSTNALHIMELEGLPTTIHPETAQGFSGSQKPENLPPNL